MKGFTLFEVLVVLVVAGVLAALALPSLIQIIKTRQSDQVISDIESYVKDTQRMAIRTSKSCTLIFTSGSVSRSCDLSSYSFDGVTFNRSVPLSFYFSFKGLSGSSYPSTFPFVLKSRSKCLVISAPLGLVRSGKLNGETCKL